MARRIAGQQFCRMCEWQPALLEFLDQERVKRLETGHAGCIVEHFCVRLSVARPADMVGRDDRHVAGGEMLPQKFDFGA